MNMKLEKTCKCITALSRANDNNPDKLCEFITGREYQVDVYYYLDRSHYKVYLNGGWNDFIILTENEFNECFRLIE
jgi:hypothetical protein